MATYWENSCSFGLRYVSWYKYLIVSLVFSHLGFWSGNLFLIAPFPDLCLLVPFFFHRTCMNGEGMKQTNYVTNLFVTELECCPLIFYVDQSAMPPQVAFFRKCLVTSVTLVLG